MFLDDRSKNQQNHKNRYTQQHNFRKVPKDGVSGSAETMEHAVGEYIGSEKHRGYFKESANPLLSKKFPKR